MMAPMISNGSKDLASLIVVSLPIWAWDADHLLGKELPPLSLRSKNWLSLILVAYSLWTFGDSMSTVNLVWTMEGSFGFPLTGKAHQDALWSLRSKVSLVRNRHWCFWVCFKCAYAGNHSQMCQPSLETLWRDHGPLAFASLHFIASTHRSTVIHNPSRQSDESRIDSTACGKKMLEWWVAITGTTVMHSLPSFAFICWVCCNNVAWCWLLEFSECFSWSFDCNTVLHLHPVAIPHPGELPAKQPCRRSHQAWQMRHHKDASHLRIQVKKSIFLHETYWKLLKYHEIRREHGNFEASWSKRASSYHILAVGRCLDHS